MTNDICQACGHHRCFHDVGRGNGVPVGQEYCDDRHADPCDCKGFVAMPYCTPFSKLPDPRRCFLRERPLLANRSIYVIGSLRNPLVPEIGNKLRAVGWDVYDDWFAGGPEADDRWKDYELARGRNFVEALAGHTAHNIFHFDKHHIDRCAAGLLVMPAGKSAHLELGYMIGTGKAGYILVDDPDRFDVMYRFAHGVFTDIEAFIETVTYP